MSRTITARQERVMEAAKILAEVHKRLPILPRIAWPSTVQRRFFAQGESELPRVRYTPSDVSLAFEGIAEARKKVGRRDRIGQWVHRQADVLAHTAHMLGGVGTQAFAAHAQYLYGAPTQKFPYTELTTLDLARRLVRSANRVSENLPAPPEPTVPAAVLAREITTAVRAFFGDQAPAVELVDGLAARASAGPTRIRIRRGAMFTDLDARQLVNHEAFVHVATALNGRRQRRLPILASNHAGTTRTQEGLAVFAELISGSLDPKRFLRIARRVIAVQRALDGADFIDVYRYFLEHSDNPVEAYSSAQRIFRGVKLQGGSAFTKDIVYLEGLCRVHVFIRGVVDTGRVDCLRLLFSGKLDLADVPALIELRQTGLCRAPKFLPPWVTDPRRFVAYFALTDVIGRASTAGLRRHYVELLAAAPAVDEPPNSPTRSTAKPHVRRSHRR